jgi:hypothetical protein
MEASNSDRTTLEDFRDGRACRFLIDVEVIEEADTGFSHWKAIVKTGDGTDTLSLCEGDTPADAITGATAAASGTLTRLHLAARFGSDEMKSRLQDSDDE